MATSRILLAATWAFFALASGPVSAQPPPMDEEEKALASVLQELTKLSPEGKAAKLNSLVNEYDALVKDKLVEVATEPGKLSPPEVLIGGPHGWNPASDGDLTLRRLFPGNPNQHKIGERAVMLESLFIHFAPEEAFKRMVPRLGSTKPTLKDAMHLFAATERQPGSPLSKQIPKELWLQFYNSPNPCYKILALEKYDSTTQSPEELLKLYRECLFGTFGYLQVRAMEGIYRSKDFRPEVQALLREFLESSPVENDGTLPSYPAMFGDPITGAEYILRTIKNSSTAELKGTMSMMIRPLPATEEKLRRLWQTDSSYMPKDKREQWQQDLRATEGLQTHLVREIATAWREREREALRLAFKALAYRTDLRADQIRQLLLPVQQMVYGGVNADPDDEVAAVYASGLVRTLGNYPSPSHEALAIALTESNDGGVHVNAAKTLAKIGGPKSLDALRKLVERVKPPEGSKDIHHDEALKALHDLEKRAAAGFDAPTTR